MLCGRPHWGAFGGEKLKRIVLLITELFISINLFANEKYFESKYFFTNTRLKLRESSNLSSKVITVLDDETCVLLLEEGSSDTIDDMDDNWVKVKTIPQKGKNDKSVEGWVFGGYLLSGREAPVLSDKNKLCLITEAWFDYDKRGGKTYSYYYLENNNAYTKLLSYSTEWSGPNYETRCYTSYRIAKEKKFLYLAFRMLEDGPYGVKIYKVDLSNIEKSQLYISYDEIKGNEQFIKNNVKLCISYSEGYDGKYKRNPKQSYKIYKKADFNSEIVSTISKEDKLILYFGSIMGEEKEIIFENEKEGFWVQCRTSKDSSDTYYWTWIE